MPIEKKLSKDEITAKLKKRKEDEVRFHQEMKTLGARKREEQEELDKKTNEERYGKAGQADSVLQNIKKELLSDETISPLGHRIKADLGWLSIVTAVLSIPFNMYKMIHAVAISKKDKKTRGMQFFMGTAGVVLGVLCAIAAVGLVYIAMPVLVIAGAVKSVLEYGWMLGKYLHERFLGEGKEDQHKINSLRAEIKTDLRLNQPIDPKKLAELTKLTNEQRHRHYEIAYKTHSLIQGIVALVGAALLLTTAAPIGGIMLATVAAYGIADVFNINPFKWIARGINFIAKKVRGKPLFDPFSHKKANDIVTELKSEVAKEKNMLNAAEKTAMQANQNEAKVHNTEADAFKRLNDNHLKPSEIAADNYQALHNSVPPPVGLHQPSKVPAPSTNTTQPADTSPVLEGESSQTKPEHH